MRSGTVTPGRIPGADQRMALFARRVSESPLSADPFEIGLPLTAQVRYQTAPNSPHPPCNIAWPSPYQQITESLRIRESRNDASGRCCVAAALLRMTPDG